MGLISEFKEFAAKGNVIDLAVGVIIGGAFGKIVTSLVEDIVMPPIGVALGKVDFSSLFVIMPGQEAKIDAATTAGKKLASFADYKSAGIATLNYGNFLNIIVQFLIVAFTIFLVVKAINKMKKPVEAPAPSTKDCPYCLSAIPLAATKCAHCTSDV